MCYGETNLVPIDTLPQILMYARLNCQPVHVCESELPLYLVGYDLRIVGNYDGAVRNVCESNVLSCDNPDGTKTLQIKGGLHDGIKFNNG